MKYYQAYVDGGANNKTHSNGYGSYAVFGKDELVASDTFLLPAKTSNQAEYMSLITLLEYISEFQKKNGKSKWVIFCDSKLAVYTTIGLWNVSKDKIELTRLNKIARELYASLSNVRLTWTRRKNIVRILGH